MSVEALNAGTTAVREGHRFDEGALAEWMRGAVPEADGPLTVRQFKGGQSNPTFRIDTPGRAFVMRRKPLGVTVPGAHAVDREARVMTALGRSGFPVPRIYGLCTNDAVIGSWFYVMECVEGRVFWNARFESVPREDRPAHQDAMNATLATLHNFDPAALGLGDYGKPGNYFERQIARWSRQYLSDEIAGRDPHMDRLIEWLPAHIPPGDESRIVHGDYRSDNMVFHATEPRVAAVLDWELSTLGHPLADFTNHLMMYRLPPAILSGLAGVDLAAAGMMEEAEYVAAYCRRTGRDGIDQLGFYRAFALFRLAAIYHGIKARALRGTAASAHADELASHYPLLAELGWQQTRSE
jgi:aminoglycoside phosphotransferase (APT) family kinase protein